MLMTRETDYALRILRVLQDGRLYTAGQLAADQMLPQSFSYKILKKLEKAGLVQVVRGTAGGCRLAADLSAVSLYDLLVMLGEHTTLSACMDPRYTCSWRGCHGGCQLHNRLLGIQGRLNQELRAHSLQELLSEP